MGKGIATEIYDGHMSRATVHFPISGGLKNFDYADRCSQTPEKHYFWHPLVRDLFFYTGFNSELVKLYDKIPTIKKSLENLDFFGCHFQAIKGIPQKMHKAAAQLRER